MATASTATSSLFTGTSAFATSLQSDIANEVAIATLPITQLQTDQTTLTGQNTELGTMNTLFTNLQTAVQGIDSAVSGASFTPTVSDPTVLTASTSDGATEGNYSVLVSNAGAYSTSLSTSTWVDTTGAAQTYSLLVGGQTYSITPTDNSAASVASAINSQEGDNVQATVVNVGSSSTPDYRISLQSSTLDDDPVDLQLVSGTSLQTQQVTGQAAQYEVNGSGLTVTTNTPTVTISPGLTVDLLASSTTADNITVERSSTTLASALTNFTTAYNAAATEVTAQRGQNGGPLQGQSIVFDLSEALGTIGTYSSGTSAISGLTDLGFTLGTNGQLTFDESTLLGSDLTNSAAIDSFLGSIAGGGFLQNVNTTLTGLVDPTSGEVTDAQTSMTAEISQIGTQITTQQAQVALLQSNLTSQASAADALISSMEQTYSYLSDLFTSDTANEEENSVA
jgi:flagellar hook-associated protein 2